MSDPSPPRPEPRRAATKREMIAYARDVIGLEISDREAARRRYSPEGVALLAAAARLLREPPGRVVTPHSSPAAAANQE